MYKFVQILDMRYCLYMLYRKRTVGLELSFFFLFYNAAK